MARKWKIALYYIGMFLLMCTLIFLIELKADYDVNNSYEKSSYAGYEKYVSVPKNLEVLGRGEKPNFFTTIIDTVTDELLMVLFLIISTIPLAIYYSAKYIEKLDNETNELIDISNNEYLEMESAGKENISSNHKALINEGYLSYKQGMFCGMLSDHLKMRDVYISFNDERNNAVILEQDENNIKFISKILKGVSYSGESILVIDKNDFIYQDTCDMMTSYGYDVKKINLSNDNGFRNKFKKQNKQYKINLLDYFDSESEIISLANIISQGNSHLTKMISALIFVVKQKEDTTMKDVYDLACEDFEKVTQKISFVKDAYNVYNELILLDNKTKAIILDEAKEILEIFNNDLFDYKEDRDKNDCKIKLEDVKNKSVVYYVSLDEFKTPYPITNVILEAVFNVCKNSFIKEQKSSGKKVYVVNPCMNEYPKYSQLAKRLVDSNKYGLTYILGLTNVKQFKDKYEYESDGILEQMQIKLFYAIRQYETTRILKQILSNHSIDEVASIINSLDTNKCIVVSNEYDYVVFNIDEPNGEKFDKYSFGEAKDESAIEQIKNKDVKLKVNYLDEFKDRVAVNFKAKKSAYSEDKKEKEKEKALNLKPELTKEEKEYIATLLKEKQENENIKNTFIYDDNYEEDDELADGDVDNKPGTIIKSLNDLYDKTEEAKNDMDYLAKGYDSSKEIEDLRDVEKHKQDRIEAVKNQKVLRSEKDINDSLDKLNEVQSKIKELINEEKQKTTHALYEQMKNLK